MALWLVDELEKHYWVQRPLGQLWVDTRQLIPMLDGLDEVADEHRGACVAAINRFHDDRGLLPLVICCRIAEYKALQAKLRLQGAVEIQPLSRVQLRRYLRKARSRLAGVRAAMRADKQLARLLTTPLFLSIIALTYKNKPAAKVRATGTLDERRHSLLDGYIKAMLSRLSTAQRERTLSSLTWLAATMQDHGQSVFYLDWMQPDWLATPALRRRLRIEEAVAISALFGLLCGLFCGLYFGLYFGPLARLLSGLLTWLIASRVITDTGQAFELVVGLASVGIVWLAFALLPGLVGALLYRLLARRLYRLLARLLAGPIARLLSRPVGPLLFGLIAWLLWKELDWVFWLIVLGLATPLTWRLYGALAACPKCGMQREGDTSYSYCSNCGSRRRFFAPTTVGLALLAGPALLLLIAMWIVTTLALPLGGLLAGLLAHWLAGPGVRLLSGPDGPLLVGLIAGLLTGLITGPFLGWYWLATSEPAITPSEPLRWSPPTEHLRWFLAATLGGSAPLVNDKPMSSRVDAFKRKYRGEHGREPGFNVERYLEFRDAIAASLRGVAASPLIPLGSGLVAAMVGLYFGLVFWGPGGRAAWLLGGLFSGLIACLLTRPLALLLRGLPRQYRLLANLIAWLLSGLFFGHLFGQAGVVAGLPVAGLVTGLPIALTWLLRGLESPPSESPPAPGKAIQRSGGNALLLGLFSGLPMGLAVGLLLGLLFGLPFGLLSGLSSGLFFGLTVSLRRGGDTYLRHHLLRRLLVPRNDVAFLDDATDLKLLSRRGGGYEFAHRLFLERFAALERAHGRRMDPTTDRHAR